MTESLMGLLLQVTHSALVSRRDFTYSIWLINEH